METTDYDFHIAGLISKLLKAELTPDEKIVLENWVNEKEENRQLFNQLLNPEYLEAQLNRIAVIDTKTAWKDLEIKLNHEAPAARQYSRMLKYAAVVFPFLLVTALLFYINNKRGPQQLKQSYKEETVQIPKIEPGGKHAVLILSDGKKVELGSAAKQTIKEEDGTSLNNGNDILAYNGNQKRGIHKILYNTIAIPRGGEYQLILEDGTKVWINSSSTLRYPTKFTGAKRIVYLTGEAYFEVAKNQAVPFIVKTNKTEVQVLGTHFNISAYDDEPVVKTTLLEGAVRLSSQNSSGLLKPGEQGSMSTNGELKVIKGVDLEEITAWKNGFFQFKDANVVQIMTKAARWYDIKVNYEGKIPTTLLSGKVSRNVDLSGLINIMQFEGIHFRMEKNNITIIN